MVCLFPSWQCLCGAPLSLFIVLFSALRTCVARFDSWRCRDFTACGQVIYEGVAIKALSLEMAEANCKFYQEGKAVINCAQLLRSKTSASGPFCATHRATATATCCQICLDMAEEKVACLNISQHVPTWQHLATNLIAVTCCNNSKETWRWVFVHGYCTG